MSDRREIDRRVVQSMLISNAYDADRGCCKLTSTGMNIAIEEILNYFEKKQACAIKNVQSENSS